MKMPPKKSGDMSAIDELMGGSSEAEAPESEGMEAAEETAEPKGDPAEILASIQAQLDELSLLLG